MSLQQHCTDLVPAPQGHSCQIIAEKHCTDLSYWATSLRVRGTAFLEGSLWAAAGSAAASCRPLTPASHFCVQVRAHQSDSLHPRLLRHDPAV